MTFNDKIRDEKLQYNINRVTAKISVLSSNKIDNCDYEEILPQQQYSITQQAKCFYQPPGKVLEKHVNAIIEEQGKISSSN